MQRFIASAALTILCTSHFALAQDESIAVDGPPPELSGLQAEAARIVGDNQKLTQEIVDSLFSFSELGFQEFETQRYLTQILESNGFAVEQGVSGIPSAWWATWGSGKPVIALGSDVDGIPKSSQMPGVTYRKPIIEGAPGHGEGHNSGQAVIITAALAVKELMEREELPGTIVIWPGIAEELVATKAWFARDGRYDGVDAVLFTHVDDSFAFWMLFDTEVLTHCLQGRRVATAESSTRVRGCPSTDGSSYLTVPRRSLSEIIKEGVDVFHNPSCTEEEISINYCRRITTLVNRVSLGRVAREIGIDCQLSLGQHLALWLIGLVG